MNYKLAKQLKDAGFPQIGESDNYIKKDGRTHDEIIAEMNVAVEHQYVEIEESDCLVPTLSELIEACGEGFPFLTKKGNVWVCCDPDSAKYNVITEGKTPEEAVGKLYIKLNNAKT